MKRPRGTGTDVLCESAGCIGVRKLEPVGRKLRSVHSRPVGEGFIFYPVSHRVFSVERSVLKRSLYFE